MTNFEKYKDDILSITEDDDNIAFDTDKGHIVSCGDCHCRYCSFNDPGIDCGVGRIRWLYEEAE